MVLGHGVALKGCAARTGKPATALDRDTATKRIAVTRYGELLAEAGFLLTAAALR